MTSSNSSTFFLTWKLRLSTVFCACSMAPESILCSIGVSSSTFSASIMPMIRSLPNNLMISSLSERKNLLSPGSPCLPDLPRSWLSIRLDSWRSVPSMKSPPTAFTASASSGVESFPPSTISVPRPAMLVAIVTAPSLPAWATISASFSWYLAFRTTCSMPLRLKSELRYSLFSTDTVPTSTGCPFAWQSRICWIIALYFPVSVL